MAAAQKSEATRERIIDAASRMFRARGYHGSSVNGIMRDAGLTVGGFYLHFRNKEDLFHAALEHSWMSSFGQLEELVQEGSCWDKAYQMAALYLSPEHFEMIEDGCPAPSLLGEFSRGTPEMQAAFTRLSMARTERIAEFFSPEERETVRPILHSVGCMVVGALMFDRASRDPDYMAWTNASVLRTIELMVRAMVQMLEAGEEPYPNLPAYPQPESEADSLSRN